MKFRSSAAYFAAAALLSAACAAFAQTSPVLNAPRPQHTQTPTYPGQTVFSRSRQSASNVQNTTSTSNVPKATDEERSAVSITSYDLNLHLTPRDQSISAEAHLTLRNNSAEPLHEIALQLSSSLHFEGIATKGIPLTYAQRTIASDVDHTGKLTEADILLPAPLAPGGNMTIQLFYSGKIPVSAQRLEAIGTPHTVAVASDWDRISEGFTGLRGFGNVVWYPVSSVPASMGQGNRLFEEIAKQKQIERNTTVTMLVTVEYFNQPPNVAVLDGRVVPVSAPVSVPTTSFPGVVTIALPKQTIGFKQLSLVLARRQVTQKNDLAIYARDDDATDVSAWTQAATQVTPLLQRWLGPKPTTPLAIVDLPESDDAPAQLGAALLTPLAQAPSADLATPLIHALAHAWFQSPRGWLDEGVPSFMVTLWIESTMGRHAALEYLGSRRGALAIAEPASPGVSTGEPLITAWDPVYLRTKAAYVLWMLRHLAGDQALQAALQQYVPEKDTYLRYFENLLEQTSGKDLHWFFKDWVYQDPGLPELSVVNAYPNKVSLGQTLVAVDIVNHGFAAADVPVTLFSTATKVTDYVHVPANSEVTHRIEIMGTPTKVQVNDGTVPEVGAGIHVVMLKTESNE